MSKEEKIEHVCPMSLCSNLRTYEPCLGSGCGWYVKSMGRCAVYVIAVRT